MVGMLTLFPLAWSRIGLAGMAATPTHDWLAMFGAGVANAVAFFLLVKSLQMTSIAHVNALNATQATMAAIAGIVIFGEPLSAALGVGIVVQVATAIAMLAGGKIDQALRQATVVLPIMAWVQFGIITLVFAALDAYGVMGRFGRRWSPSKLPTTDRQTQPIVHIIVTALVSPKGSFGHFGIYEREILVLESKANP